MTYLDTRFGSCKIEMLTEKLRKKEGFFLLQTNVEVVMKKKKKTSVELFIIC